MAGETTALARVGEAPVPNDRDVEATITRRIAAPAHLVWALVADTNRFDRAAGLSAGKYAFERVDPNDESSRQRVASTRELGFDIRWIEPPYEWIEGRMVRGARTFLSGPVTRGGFSVDLAPIGDGTTEITARSWVAGKGFLFSIVGAVMRGKFKKALRSYLDAIEGVLAKTHATLEYDWTKEPPAAAARRALMVGRTDEVTSGKRSPTSESDLAYRARRFAQAPVAPALRQKLLDLLSSRPDEELTQIRPFEVARAWNEDKREVLRAFLHAARAGLVELQWQLNCPTCRVGAEVVDTLGGVGKQAHCDACNIAYDLDFAAHVEAAFKVSPSIRKVETAVYCASSPWFRPHVFAQLAVPPRGRRTLACALPGGALLVRTLQGARRAEIEIDEAPRSLTASIDATTLALAAEDATVARGQDTTITLENKSDREVVVLLERTGWNADVVLGSVIATLPDFLDLFATEAPASGVELSVGALTLLFSDLTGSTALYERVGDARAFAVVQEHFELMTAAIAKHEGAVVKTMGDAVMATFSSPAHGLRAAIEAIEACNHAHGELGIDVKIGLHEGPCLAVRANDRLDFFGTTVNVSARLQALAGGSEIVVMEELLAHEGVAAIAKEHALEAAPFTASLKGIKEAQRCVRWKIRGA